MKKTIVILFVMLQFGLILGAKENFSTEGIDVLAVKECIVNDYHDVITVDDRLGGQPSVEARFHTADVAYGFVIVGNDEN